jgi:hypothetical protein
MGDKFDRLTSDQQTAVSEMVHRLNPDFAQGNNQSTLKVVFDGLCEQIAASPHEVEFAVQEKSFWDDLKARNRQSGFIGEPTPGLKTTSFVDRWQALREKRNVAQKSTPSL